MSQLGQGEEKGAAHNPVIVNYFKEVGVKGVNDDETPWCSVFVGWCALKADLNYSKSALARSWMNVGTPVSEPEPGDIVIFWRDSLTSFKGHVGFFMGFSKDASRVYCLGGNQGNQVSISGQPADKILGYRRLTSSSIITLPQGVLKLKDSGPSVIQLQDALKAANYDVGTSDGYFGERTRQALQQLQANGGLKADGVYGPTTMNYLNTLLNE